MLLRALVISLAALSLTPQLAHAQSGGLYGQSATSVPAGTAAPTESQPP